MVLSEATALVVRRYQGKTDDALQGFQIAARGVDQVPGWELTTFVKADNGVFLSIHRFTLQGHSDQQQAALASAEQANSIEEAWVERQNITALLKGPVEAIIGIVMGESG